MERAINGIEAELTDQLATFERQGKMLEAQRLRMRTTYDIEMMRQIGTCSGIENYSMHIDGRSRGSAPNCLLDYFPEDFLLVIDESHVAVPQVGGMYEGDMSRKRNLVEHGFRLPSAMDNRPLRWEEFLDRIGQTIYLSATPGNYELDKVQGDVVEQIIRPTGLIDPEVVIKPTKGQIDDLISEIRQRTERNERVLVTTLTKKMSEDLTDYLLDAGVRTRYLHSEVDTLKRIELLRDLRLGAYDVLVGINLLREGLDLPEVSLVAILDADKEGFLRSDKSLIQTIGRAARNVSGQVHMYADKITPSMASAIDETNRRRAKQVAYNEANGVDPQPLRKKIADITEMLAREDETTQELLQTWADAGVKGRAGGVKGRRAPVPTLGEGALSQHAGELAGLPSSRPRGADPGPHRPDEGRGRGAPVRARRPAPRRDLRPPQGAPADGRGNEVDEGLPIDFPQVAQPDQPGDHQRDVEHARHLLDHDQRPGVVEDRVDVRQTHAGERGEGQEEQLEPVDVRAGLDAVRDERTRPEDLRGGVQVGEGPGDDGEGRADGVQLVAGDDVVVEQVADHRVGDEEVEGHVEDGRGQHDPVGVPADRLEDREHHRGDPEDDGDPAQHGGGPDRPGGDEHDAHLDHADHRATCGGVLEEGVDQHHEELRGEQDRGGVPARGFVVRLSSECSRSVMLTVITSGSRDPLSQVTWTGSVTRADPGSLAIV